MAFLNERALQNIKAYKYNAVDHSPVTKYILQHWWNWCLQFVPMWMAPNLITLIGLLFIVVNYVTMAYYVPDLYMDAPRWTYLTCAIGMFAYQTLDALDGKQARRTGSGSALGQLFDHGCDGLNCSLSAITIASSLKVGTNWLSWITLWNGLIPFFCATWEEYHTGCLNLGVINGPTEGLLMISAAHLISAVVGPQFWLASYKEFFGLTGSLTFLPDMRLSTLMIVSTLIMLAVTCYFNIRHAIDAVHKKRKDVGEALSHFIPPLLLLVSSTLWVYLSPSNVLAEYPRRTMMTVGFAMAYLLSRLIVNHLSDDPFPVFHPILVPLSLYAGHLVLARIIGTPVINEWLFLNLNLVYVIGIYMYYNLSIIDELTRYLNIFVFKIKPPQQQQHAAGKNRT